MGRKKKSSFYHVRWNVVKLNEEKAAEILAVSVEEIKRFDIEGAPLMAERLLLLWDRKNIGVEGWQGWLFSRGVLIYKKSRWKPRMIIDNKECNEELFMLRDQIKWLNSYVEQISNSLPNCSCISLMNGFSFVIW